MLLMVLLALTGVTVETKLLMLTQWSLKALYWVLMQLGEWSEDCISLTDPP